MRCPQSMYVHTESATEAPRPLLELHSSRGRQTLGGCSVVPNLQLPSSTAGESCHLQQCRYSLPLDKTRVLNCKKGKSPSPPRLQNSSNLPGLLISLGVFCSKNMYCAMVTGYADEGSVLIEVNAVENTDSCSNAAGTHPPLLVYTTASL